MSSFGLVALSAIWGMLKTCAPGHEVRLKKHRYWVLWRGKMATLPTGPHGKGNPGTQIGHVRHMIRQLEIEFDCAKRELAALR